MFNNKFLATLIGIMVAVLAIWYSDFVNSGSVLENFVNVPQTVKVMPVAQTPQGLTALPQGSTFNKSAGFPSPASTMGSAPMFMIPGTFQNSLEPRTNPLNNYGAYIRYNMPSEEHQAVPKNPLTFGSMVHEGYTKEDFCSSGGCGSGVQSCNAGGLTPNARLNAHAATPSPTSPDHSSQSYHAARDSIPMGAAVTSELPVPDMGTLNADGTVDENPIIYDRMMYANQKSRLHGQADWIRGDLAIVPCKGNWFNVSVQPQIDLNSGAMAVLGGLNNETSQELYQLQYQSSGTADSTLGGVDLGEALSVAAQKSGYQGMATNDVQFTAFP